MKDFIPKGTGNSRWMKSSIPTGTTWEEALAMLRAGTFPFDLNGINSAGVAQMGDALNKANLLTDDTAVLFGLGADAVLNDVFVKMLDFIDQLNEVSTKLNDAAFNSGGTIVDINGSPIGIRVATGSYQGKGTSGSGNKNSLSFSFDPKVVIIRKDDDGYADNGYANGAVFIKGQSKGLADGFEQPATSAMVLTITWSTNKVTWYASGSASSNAINQLNKSNTTYRYVVIG